MEFLVIFFLVLGVFMVILTVVSLSIVDTKLMFGPKPKPPEPKKVLR